MWKKVSNNWQGVVKRWQPSLCTGLTFFLEHQPGDHLDYAHISPISWHNASVIFLTRKLLKPRSWATLKAPRPIWQRNPGGCRCSASLGSVMVEPGSSERCGHKPSRCCTWGVRMGTAGHLIANLEWSEKENAPGKTVWKVGHRS